MKGRKLTSNMIEFGECVHFLPPKHLDNGEAEIRWRDGACMGLKLTSGEKLNGTPEGMLKVRTVRRKPESDTDGMRDGSTVLNHFRGNPTSSLRMTKC